MHYENPVKHLKLYNKTILLNFVQILSYELICVFQKHLNFTENFWKTFNHYIRAIHFSWILTSLKFGNLIVYDTKQLIILSELMLLV